MKDKPHAYSQSKRSSNQSNQCHYYSHFYLKTKQTHADYAIRAAKRTGNALGNFMKLSSLPDESTQLIKTNLKNQTIKYTTATNNSKNTAKPKPQR